MYLFICLEVFMKHAHDMDLRDMLDETARMLGGYETEAGTKQSFGYEVQLTNKFLHVSSHQAKSSKQSGSK